jgi:hypothetical protein
VDLVGEALELLRGSLEGRADTRGVELEIAMDEYVPESAEPAEVRSQLGAQHGFSGERVQDLLVRLGASSEGSGENVIRGVEDDLAPELQAALDEPGHVFVLLEPLEAERALTPKAARYLAQTAHTGIERARSERHSGSPKR